MLVVIKDQIGMSLHQKPGLFQNRDTSSDMGQAKRLPPDARASAQVLSRQVSAGRSSWGPCWTTPPGLSEAEAWRYLGVFGTLGVPTSTSQGRSIFEARQWNVRGGECDD